MERVKKHLGNPDITKFYTGYFECNPKLPLSGFIIIDRKEIVSTFPTPFGEPHVWVSIEHPELVYAYKMYFDRLWESSSKVTSEEEIDKLIARSNDENGTV